MNHAEGRWSWGRALCLALAVTGMLWGVLLWLNPQGIESRVFFERGLKLFEDFMSTRTCAEFGYVNDKQEALTACYPALGPMLSLPFPPTRAGGAWFFGVGLLMWVASFVALLREKVRNADWGMTALLVVGCVLSSIMLHAFEWGNQIVYAAAGVTLFVAWRDAQCGWKRTSAALALAVAAVMKLVPAAFAVLYVQDWLCAEEEGIRRRTMRDLLLFMGAGTLLFVVPFAWYGGWEGFCQWFANAKANATGYAHRGQWGVVPMGRTLRVLRHLDVSQPWNGLVYERTANVLVGLSCLALAGWGMLKKRTAVASTLMLVTAAVLLVPGNMHVYTGLYLLPVMALRVREGMDWLEAACWLVMLCPLQIPFGAGCLNHPLANCAFLVLLARSSGLWCRR